MTQKESVKDRIVRVAWELFEEKGYENTTIDDILKKAETSKGSFYYYFESKESLIRTLSTLLDQEYSKLRDEMDPDMNSYDKLIYMNYKIHSMIESKINMDLLASLYSTQLVNKSASSLLDQNRVYYQLLNAIIEEGQKRGQLTQSKTVREIAKYYAMCERAMITEWCLCKGAYSLGEYSKEYMPMMLQGFKKDSQ